MWGFTRNEQRALLFLISTFVVGLGVQFYQSKFQPLPPLNSLSLVKEEQVPVTSPPKAQTASRPFRFDLNRASMAELEKIPGIGPALAQRIVDWQKAHGPFQQVEDLLQVKGIGKKTLEKIRPFVYIHQAE